MKGPIMHFREVQDEVLAFFGLTNRRIDLMVGIRHFADSDASRLNALNELFRKHGIDPERLVAAIHEVSKGKTLGTIHFQGGKFTTSPVSWLERVNGSLRIVGGNPLNYGDTECRMDVLIEAIAQVLSDPSHTLAHAA